MRIHVKFSGKMETFILPFPIVCLKNTYHTLEVPVKLQYFIPVVYFCLLIFLMGI